MEQRGRRGRTTSDRRGNTGVIRPKNIDGTRSRISAEEQAGRQKSEGQGTDRSRITEFRRSPAVRQRPGEESGGRQRSESQNAGKQRLGEESGRQRPGGQGIRRQPQSGRPGKRKPPMRKPQSRRRRKRNLGIKIAMLVLLVVAAVAAVFLWKKYSPSKKEYDLNKYYGIEKEGQLAITVDNQVVEPHGMIADGKAYVQYDVVRDYINSRFYWDSNENVLLYTLPKDMVTVEVGSKDYSVSKEKKSEEYVILKTEGSTAYIALDFVQQYTNIEYELYNDPNRVMIVTKWGKTTVAAVKKNTQVRYQGGVKSPILTQIKKKDEVTVLESEGDWKKVRTKDGFIGYVKSKALRKEEEKKITRAFEEQEFTNIKKDYTINMAWHNVTNNEANSVVLQRIEMLRNTARRENLINQIMAEALRVGLDGINVDFEKISDECGEHYIQFIRELSVRCRQNGIVLSIDNYVPKGYNMQYNRKEQGIVADYVIIMGYDEHYGGSPVAGPVASYNFVKEGIEETLKEVPKEKVINGIPFFSRLWEETPKTAEELSAQAGTAEAEYETKVDSQAFGMAAARSKVDEAGAQLTWDDELKQNYATWIVENTTYEIWLEDEQSIEEKLKLMKEYQLAGVSAWALGQESPEVWNLIQKYVN